MTGATLLAEVRARGGDVLLVGGRLRLRAPAPLPAELLDELRAHRAALEALVAPPPVWWYVRRRSDGPWEAIQGPADYSAMAQALSPVSAVLADVAGRLGLDVPPLPRGAP